MKVTLIAYSQRKPNENPIAIVEEAASVCYDSKPTETGKIALYCAESGHLSVWEHISFTFKIEGVSRAYLAQQTRHRHNAYAVRSQRYCDETKAEFVVPEGFNEEQSAAYEAGINAAKFHYSRLKSLGVASENARMILPNACETTLYITLNARSLIENSWLRLCTRAQKEIRDVYKAMRNEIKPVCPELAELMRPKCEKHKDYPFCTEHKSCGRHATLKAIYTKEKGAD